jgi:ABC-type Fe2+-enterobactin transport system substrate-binding protein
MTTQGTRQCATWPVLFAWLLLALTLGACTRAPQAPVAASGTGWPRTFHNADDSVTVIPGQPRRILSTSVAISGTLLAIEAPLIASAAANNGEFFAQWSGVARARGVENVWAAGSVDLEAAYAAQPDLIVVATRGADSALEQLAELRKIAPTIVLDYGSQSWQTLAVQIGEATGLEAQAAAKIAEFDRHVATVRARLNLPAGQVNIISYNGPGMSNPIATATGAHGRLLQSLGFVVEPPDPRWHNSPSPARDFVWAQYEQLTRLTAPTTFLLRADDDRVSAFLADPVLHNLTSIRSRQVYSLGANAFRIDYFSATEIVDSMQKRFGNPSTP